MKGSVKKIKISGKKTVKAGKNTETKSQSQSKAKDANKTTEVDK